MHALGGTRWVQKRGSRCHGNTVRLGLAVLASLLGIALLAQPASAGTHLGGSSPVRRLAAPLTWGGLGDSTIKDALANDNGAGSAAQYLWLAQGIALRSAAGWSDPTAQTYLHAAQAVANPYGLTYAYDAFADGTVNPASTIYTITLYQVGEALLSAYKAGQATRDDVVNVMRVVVAQPRISVPTGMALAYSNSPNDVKAGYVVHNVDQAIAMFLSDTQHAGIVWSTVQISGWIRNLSTYEKSTYQRSLFGWAYRNGGSQAVQDPGHNGMGVMWGMWWDPSSIGVPALNHMQSTDYGVANGAGVHASLAQLACSQSAQWKPEYATFETTTAGGAFASTSLMATRLGQDAPACDGGHPAAGMKFAPRRINRTAKLAHVAPDAGIN